LKDSKEENKDLGWRDYLALVIAMLTTTLLPILIFIALLIIALVAFAFIASQQV